MPLEWKRVGKNWGAGAPGERGPTLYIVYANGDLDIAGDDWLPLSYRRSVQPNWRHLPGLRETREYTRGPARLGSVRLAKVVAQKIQNMIERQAPLLAKETP